MPAAITSLPARLLEPASGLRLSHVIRGMAGALLGALVGYGIFRFFLRYGFYAPIAPAALLGIGCGLASGRASWLLAVGCGLAGLWVSIYTEWSAFPFAADESFGYFLANLHSLDGLPVKWLFFLVGAGLAGWFGRGRLRSLAGGG